MSREIFRILPARSALVASAVLLGSAYVASAGVAPGVTVTKDDGEAAATKKPAGSVVTYTNTIENPAGAAPAAGVQFKDPDIANATYVAGSLQATPVAIDDSYSATVVANSRIDTATSGFSVVTNDFPGYVAGVPVAASALTITNVGTPAHGTVSMTTSGAGVGRFVYTPTPGYTGSDSFTYTVSNTVAGGAPASITGTVNLTVGGPVIWFVNPAAGVNGDGTLHSPFNNLAAAVSAIGASENHRVFLFSGGSAQTTGIALNAGGWLVGQGATGTTFDALMGATYPADTVTARPSINLPSKPLLSRSSGGNTVTLANNFLIAGLDITNSGGGFAVAGGAGVNAGTIGHATTPDVTIGASGSSSGAFSLNGGNGAIAVNAPLTATAGRPVQIQGRTASTVTFSRAISGTGTGISLASNTGATVAFTGGLSLSTGANPAFAVTGGGTVTATQDNTAIVNTITTSGGSGTALEVANSTIGPAGLTFRSIHANGGSNGIRLSATGSGGLTITGNGSANSGGTLQNLSGDGIQLTNASNVSLTDMAINSVTGSWIDATTVTGLTLNRVSADLSTDHGFKANSLTNLSITGGTFDRGGAGNGSANFNGFDITNLLGTSTVTGSTFRRSNTIQFRVNNTAATDFAGAPDSLTVSGTVWNTHTSAFSGDHLSVNAGTGGNFRLVMNATAGINTVNEGGTPSSGGGIGVQATSSGINGRMDVSVTGLKTTANTAGVVLGQTGGGALTYSVTGNKTANGTGFSATGSGAIFVTHASTGGTSLGTISDNSINHTAGPSTNAMQVVCEGSGATGGTSTTVISNNVVTGNFQRGLHLQARVANPVLNATVSGNTFIGTDTTNTGLQVVNIESGGSGSGHAATIRLNMASNTATIGAATYIAAYRLVNRASCVFQLQDFIGSTTTDVQNWVTSTKSNTGTPVTVTATAPFTATSGSVPLPLLFLPQAEAVATPAVETAAAPVVEESLVETADVTAEPAAPVVPVAPAIRQEDFDALVAEAIARWTATGLNEAQVARLKAMRFQVSDLPGAQLGQMGDRAIEVNRHAAGHEWHIDPTPQDDSDFRPGDAPTRLLGAGGAAAERVDLLTTLMHEMGHALGLPDLYQSKDRDNVMFGLLPKGERRLPAKDQAKDAVATDEPGRQFLSGGLNPITIGNLPPGKSVVITYQVQIDNPFALGATQLSSQATVSGSNFPDVLSDDPNTGAISDATVTLLDRPDTTVLSINRVGSSPNNGASVSWQVVLADPVINLTASHFSLVATSLGGSPAITGVVNPSAPAASATWTVTASTGTGSGSLGLNLANDSGTLSHDVTNLPFTGQVYAIDRTPPTATLVVADSTLTAGETPGVTITFSEPVTGFDNADLTISNGTLSAVSSADGGTTWTATLTPDTGVSDASNLITLDNTGVADAVGNAGIGTTDSNNYSIDTARPSATLMVADSALRAGETSLVTITFNEAVTGFTNADLTVPNGTLTAISSADGGTTWTATLTPSAGVTDASNVITLDNTGVTDDAGNAGTGTTDSNNYAIDTARPTATLMVADGALAAGETSLVTITFSEAVSGFDNDDLAVANGTLSVVSSGDGGITWTATFTPTANVTDATNVITLDNSGVTDGAGNAGTGTTDSNNYAIDSARPTATIVVADSSLRAGETSGVTITFSEEVTGFTNGDLSVDNGTLSTVTSADGGITWTATLTPAANVTDSSNLTTLDNTGVTDAAGNTGAGTTDSNNYAIDTERPTAVIVVADDNLMIGETSPVTITFNEAVSGFDNDDLTVEGGTLSPVSTADGGITWTATFTPTPNLTDATNVITLANTGVTDGAGNTGTGNSVSNNYAVTSLSVSIAAVTGSTAEGTGTGTTAFTFDVTRTGSTTGEVTMDYAVTGAADATDFGGTLPAGVFTLPDGQASAVLTIQVAKDATREADEIFTVTLSNPSGGFVVATAAADSTITNDDFEADLAITKTDGVATAVPGGSVTYTITASNAGPDPVTGATVADTFPASLTATWTAVGAGGGTATAAGSGNINDTVNLPVGGSVTYTVTATISPSATGTLSNTATVSSATTDPDPANNSATDTDTLTPQADLAITKTDGVTTATPGGSVTYTITASNAGPSDVTGATVADTFPPILNATWTAVGAGGGTATASGSGNINDTVNLPVGASVTYTVTANIASSATGTLSNTATVSSAVTDPNPANNSATDTDTLMPQADLAINKTDGVTTAVPGESVTYTITATNAGPSNAMATVADTFPATLTATWTAVGAGGGTATASGSGNINDTVNLPAGASVTYTVTATIAPTATGTLSNTATISSAVTDPNPANNSATDTDTLTPRADLAITKTDGVTTATPGGSVTYTITATNAGPSSVTGATVADTLPAALTATWTAVGAGGGTATASGSGNINDTVDLPVGASVTYTVTANISASATGTLSNTATISAPGGVTDPDPADNSATDTDTLVAQADLAITKTDGVSTAVPGQSVTYTITATNAGPSNITGATVSDTLPASITGATWTASTTGGATATASGSGNISDTVNLPAGSSVIYTVTAPISAAATGTLVNTATISSAATDPNPANNSATDTDTLTPQADLAITKTDGVGTAIPGTAVTYTITASNAGPSNVTGATVADTLPATISGATWTAVGAGGGTATAAGSGNINDAVNLPVGGSVTYTVTGTISSTATGTLSNTATVSSSVTDPNPANNAATDTDTLTPQADLAVTLGDSPDPVNALGNLTYSISLTNNGPSASVTPQVTLPLPAGTTFVSATAPGGWTAGTPAVGATGTITFTASSLATGDSVAFTVIAQVDATIVNDTILTATATASSATTDPTAGNNSATTTTLAKSGADLALTLTDSPDPVFAGNELTYTVGVSNNGPLDAETVAVTPVMPAGTTFVSLTAPAGWTATTPAVGSAGPITISRALFANATDATFTLVVKVAPNVADGTVLNATAAVSSTTVDIVPGNNSGTATTTVATQADLAVSITAAPTTAPKGSEVTFSVGVSNQGPSDAASAVVSLPLPAHMTFVSATAPSGWTTNAPAVGAAGTVQFTAASLATGESRDFTVFARVNDNAPTGTILTAAATASSSAADPQPADNSATATAAVGTVNPTAVQPVTTGIVANTQSGLYEVNVNVTNTTPNPINGFRLHVDYSAYLAAYPSLRLYNASNPAGAAGVYVDYPFPVAVDGVVTMKLSFYTSTRTFPSPFAPQLSVEILPSSQLPDTNGAGVQPRVLGFTDGNLLLEFPSVTGKWYRVRYSSDMVNWQDCPVPLQAGSTRMQWIDSGPPFTDVPPSQAPARYYRVNEIAAP